MVRERSFADIRAQRARAARRADSRTASRAINSLSSCRIDIGSPMIIMLARTEPRKRKLLVRRIQPRRSLIAAKKNGPY